MLSFEELIRAGEDSMATKYYWIALATLLYYDYLLTLKDEVEYAWRKKKPLTSQVIFILNRYLPMLFSIWGILADSSVYLGEACNKTAFMMCFFFVWCTFVAQIVLNVRIYAITAKNVVVAGFFAGITVSLFVLGMCITVLVAKAPAIENQVPQLLPAHIEAYRVCGAGIQGGSLGLGIVYMAVSLGYDILMFLVIIYHAAAKNRGRFKMSHMFRTIVRDSSQYFLVIFTSHLVLEISLLAVRPGLRLLPGLGTYVFLPVMISRLVLSLRKAADTSEAALSLMTLRTTSNPGPGRHTSRNPHDIQLTPISGDAA